MSDRSTFAGFADAARAIPGVIAVTRSPPLSGYCVDLANGWSVSVQCGPLNYCDHYRNWALHDRWLALVPMRDQVRHIAFADECMGSTTTAEIAQIAPNGDLVRFDSGDEESTVWGHVPYADVLATNADVARRPSGVSGNPRDE